MRHLLTLFIAIPLLLATTSGFSTTTKAPALQLQKTAGEINFSQLKGNVVYLDFWASWCEPCRESFPWMATMKEKYRDQGFEVVAINLDKEKQLAEQFLQSMKVNFIVAFDAEGKSAAKFGLQGMPGSYLIGRDGSIQGSHLGFRDKDKGKLETAIQKLLQQRQEDE